jgi:hypothetical protein
VALDGDTVVVGDNLNKIGANKDQGAVYVFTRSGVVWTQRQKIVADDGAAGDLFGTAAAISNDTHFRDSRIPVDSMRLSKRRLNTRFEFALDACFVGRKIQRV